MLYIFCGTDHNQGLNKARNLIASLKTKKPDASYVEVNADNWNDSIIQEHVGGQGLFSSKYIIFLNRVGDKKEILEKVTEFLDTMKESENIFIVHEGKVDAETKKLFEKKADKVVFLDEKEKNDTKRDFNIFSLADAIGAKDNIKAWSIYRQAIGNGLESESILGTMFWQVKSMILAFNAKSATEAGLNPFVYSKVKRHVTNYKEKELLSMSEELINLYHKGHRGMIDLELGIERFLLELN